jgi:predicted transcriptional regulator
MESTAQKIKRLLNECKGSWPEISRSSGVPYFTIAKIASGVSENPRSKTCDALTSYFDGRVPEKNKNNNQRRRKSA